MKSAEVIIKDAMKISSAMHLEAKHEVELVGNLRAGLVSKVFEKSAALEKMSMALMAKMFFREGECP